MRFSDDDNDIVKACYENGECDTSYFDGGSKGKSLDVYGSGTATITVSEGKYTFYAIDASGNETSLVVTLMMKNRENNNNYSSPKDYNNRNYYQDFDYDSFIREFFSDWGGFFGNFFGY